MSMKNRSSSLATLRRVLLGGAAVATLLAASQARAATMSQKSFGETTAGEAVTLYTMTAKNGVSVSFMSYGGVITQIMTPDRDGKLGNIVINLPSLREYQAHSRKEGLFFGALIGRYGNRIAGGHFSLDGKTYSIPANNGKNSLHGGPEGFDTRVWTVTPGATTGETVSAALSLVSPDGDQGFPGTMHVTVTYSLTDAGAFSIDYKATTDKPTVLNLTNHSYFTLGGPGARNGILDEVLQINASRYTPIGATLIPSGDLASVADTPFDFRKPKPIGQDLRAVNAQLLYAHGYDHNWVIDGPKGRDGLRRAAILTDPTTGRTLECDTDQPGVQVYTSNFLDGSVGGDKAIYRESDAVTFETQHFPDSPNQKAFPTTRLNPGQTFHSRTVFRFGTVPAAR